MFEVVCRFFLNKSVFLLIVQDSNPWRYQSHFTRQNYLASYNRSDTAKLEWALTGDKVWKIDRILIHCLSDCLINNLIVGANDIFINMIYRLVVPFARISIDLLNLF